MSKRKDLKDPAYHELWALRDRWNGEFEAGWHTGHFREEGRFAHTKPHGATRDDFNKSVIAAYGPNTIVRVIYGPRDSDIVSLCGVLHATHA